MKKYLSMSLLILCATPSAAEAASYVIHLDNGARFETPLYWEEGNQIDFFTLGGSLGIEKKYVRSIERVSGHSHVASYPAVPIEPKQESLEPAEKTVSEERGGGKTAIAQKGARKKKGTPEDQRLLKEFEALKERFQGVDSMPTAELFALVKDLRSFRDKILSSHLGSIYDKELLAVSEMGDRVAQLIRAGSG